MVTVIRRQTQIRGRWPLVLAVLSGLVGLVLILAWRAGGPQPVREIEVPLPATRVAG